MRRYLTALRPVYVPFREAEPDQLHDAWCPATAAKRHPEGQRDDGLTRDGRVTARRERIFFRADFGATKWNSSRRNEKKDVQKSDIALVE